MRISDWSSDVCSSDLIEPLADPDAAGFRIDARLIAVEPVAGRIVARAETVIGDLLPAVRRQRQPFVEPHRGAIADDRALIERDALAVGIIVDLCPDLVATVAGHALGIEAPHTRADPSGAARPRHDSASRSSSRIEAQ